jgi:hypothetical protein
MDWRPSGDQDEASQEAEKMPDLSGSCCWKIGFRESGCRIRRIGICETVVAPASVGADAHANHESAASAVRELSLAPGPVGAGRVVGAVGPHESDHSGVTAAIEREARKRPDAADDPSSNAAGSEVADHPHIRL